MHPKPILKWAGGKSQMLDVLKSKLPFLYNQYIEPFLGGGALFFALQPRNAVISDSNPELINLYQQIANNVEEVIKYLNKFEISEKNFYLLRKIHWEDLPKVEAAARTIFLNRTCYNGLYRVNKQGYFNVPYGKYENPKICDEKALYAASHVLKKAKILCEDYKTVLLNYASSGDLVFLDPPYLPISHSSDFKRYTKEQFHEDDHIQLAQIVSILSDRGCHVILTNSNHPLVRKLYSQYSIEVFHTKRCISCHGDARKGEDIIVTSSPKQKNEIKGSHDQIRNFPPTRYMGSKVKLLSEIWKVASRFQFETVLDLFSGSGAVSYMFKTHGKAVLSNDYMAMSATFAKAMIENNNVLLSNEEAKDILVKKKENDHFVANLFRGLYYSDSDNELIDIIRSNIQDIKDEYKRAISMTALIRACMKKRPRGIFTYVGEKYNDGRKDLRKTFSEHFLEAVDAVNKAVFDNGRLNIARMGNAMDLNADNVELVYIDPPYYSPYSDNEYVRRYHFVEGLARNWKEVDIQYHTKTKKIKSYFTPFSTRKGVIDSFDVLFKKYQKSIIMISYSSNALPTMDEIVQLLSKYKQKVDVVPIDYKYSFGNQKDAKTHRNYVKEYIFVGY